MTEMPRMTIRVPRPMLDSLDELVEEGLYPDRSSAARDGFRRLCHEFDVATDGQRVVQVQEGPGEEPRWAVVGDGGPR